jgi:hypothetical protein
MYKFRTPNNFSPLQNSYRIMNFIVIRQNSIYYLAKSSSVAVHAVEQSHRQQQRQSSLWNRPLLRINDDISHTNDETQRLTTAEKRRYPMYMIRRIWFHKHWNPQTTIKPLSTFKPQLMLTEHGLSLLCVSQKSHACYTSAGGKNHGVTAQLIVVCPPAALFVHL